MRKGSIFAISGAAMAAFSLASLPLYSERVTQKEMGVQTQFGKVEEVITAPGLHFHWPFTEQIDTFPLTRNITRVNEQSGNGGDVRAGNVVTSDMQPVKGGVIVHWEISSAKGDPAAVYTDYAANGADFEEIMNEIVEGHAMGALVSVIGQQSSIKLSSNLNHIMKDIKAELQAKLDEAGVPVEVSTVVQNGIGLEKSAREKLQKIMVAQQENEVLDQRMKNAEKATNVIKKEAQNTAEMYKVLREANVPESQIATLICLQLASAEDTVNKAFTPGCMGGEGTRATVSMKR